MNRIGHFGYSLPIESGFTYRCSACLTESHILDVGVHSFSGFVHRKLAHPNCFYCEGAFDQRDIRQNTFQMEGEVNNELADVIMHRRAIFEQAYIQLRQAHPSLPAQLREFQVSCIAYQFNCVLRAPRKSLNFRSTLLLPPYMAQMVAIYCAACP